MFHAAIYDYLIQFGQKAITQAVAQAGDTAAFFRQNVLRNLTSLAETNDAGNVQRTRPHTAFVAAAVNDGRDFYAGAHVKGSATLGAIAFVRSQRSKIEVEFFDI